MHDRYTKDEIDSYYAQGLWRAHTFFGALEQQVAERPDKVFLTDSTTSYTFRELRDAALRLAVGMVRLGIGAGDRVAVQVPNWTEFAVISLAISRVGAVIVPIMPIYRRDEVGYIVESAGVRAAFTAGRYRKFDHGAMFLDLARSSSTLDTVVVVRDESVPEGAVGYDEVLADVPSREDEAQLPAASGPDEPFVIVFSSGTTSRPKGCVHTFNTMACGARLLGRAWNYTEEDVQFGPSPITHTTGLVTSVILPLVHGAGSHLMEQWEPREGLARIAKYGCTAAVSATTFLQMILSVYEPEVHDASSMRFWTCAGSPIPGAFVRQVRSALPDMRVLSLYGRTENITTAMCPIDDDPERSVTSDGKALPLQEVRIVDAEGREVPRGAEGDIAYRGAMNSLEYINQPQETAAMYTADGFSRSGDLGTMDEDGYVRVTGRLKDIVIRGGLNISVRQVEDLLAAHPAVGEAAVVGMPDEKMGERVCCYLVPAPGAEPPSLDGIKDYLLGEGLAIQKVPERLEIIEELPTTATGKIQKHLLRADIAERLGAGR
ncbi:o-succinylbenzoate--CoA ligase [Streptomyces albus]|uniref:O-succinylbenzoate--CoA ligase n=1 Tax=Streptomyces albus (strain ATCC 21838 / DSM 41398 / FERM P-419 / JCM 4703 / NBRC 107858) TaxID=1081613 RepID=A0A0B5F8W8_STRA4|nr:o-succinylbenzoate--CoA ligase [Streptomyces albus]AYN37301.1 cyclohexanecarboxylate-CoA ligase [Streptomyces albus]